MKERPPHILKSIKAGNLEHLQNAGRKGNQEKARRREEQEAYDALAAEISELEEWQRKLSTNEHIIDPDGKDLNYIADED
jgi:glutamyl-tRNA reductase